MATLRAGFMADMATSACPLQRERCLRKQRARLVPPRATASNSNGNGSMNKFAVDRRDVLLGLGGAAATAASTVMTPGGVILPAMAAPVAPPDLSKCHLATDNTPNDEPMQCCPPYSSADIVDYDFPRTPLRVRRPAHEVKYDKEYLAKYETAVNKMKNECGKDHPWNFYQQALIHCAYCNGAYDQVNFPGVPLQVHKSWLFLPWHRYYLHFFERILGKLINDDTFALPFWNFDSEEGMTVPEIFTYNTNSPLYNDKRETSHYHPAIIDYKFKYTNYTPEATGKDLVQANLSYMQKTFKESLAVPELFMGDAARAGEADLSGGAGGLETIHNSLHMWVGPIATPHTDMGNFATAAKDCMFYCLHANVDRLWQVYRNSIGHQYEFDDSDWLDSSFIFYDENKRVVRVKVRDSLKPAKLGYTYEEVPIPWMKNLKIKRSKETKGKTDLKLVPVSEFGTGPRKLGTTPLRVLLPRPKKNRSKKEKTENAELIYIKNIHVASHDPARFDVYVAAPYGELAGPDLGEFAGSFVQVAHTVKSGGHKDGKKNISNLKLGITTLLEDIEAEDAEKLVVTIVPGDGDITIGDIKIGLVQAR